AKRMILRDLEERKLLLAELANADQGEARLRAEAADLALAAAPPIPARSLARPVPGRVLGRYGEYQDPGTRARLLRRGLELKVRGGDPAVAAAAGQVVWAGPLRGLGVTVVIRHAGFVTVTTGLARAEVAAGD